jgi:AcrR family transcriptional regulator
MARTLNAAVHAVRREAFIDVAQRLIQEKGYEQMSVQDVLDELDASRGAFYHYFDSKQALLEAVLERVTDLAMVTLTPVVEDPSMSAVHKLESVFAGIARWKGERKELMLAILKVWVSDDNALVREKFRHSSARRLVPLLSEIIRQGIDEGAFTARSPDHTARVLVHLIHGFQDEATALFIARQANTVSFETVERTSAANTEAVERILGIPAGSLTLIDRPTLRLWFG